MLLFFHAQKPNAANRPLTDGFCQFGSLGEKWFRVSLAKHAESPVENGPANAIHKLLVVIGSLDFGEQRSQTERLFFDRTADRGRHHIDYRGDRDSELAEGQDGEQ